MAMLEWDHVASGDGRRVDQNRDSVGDGLVNLGLCCDMAERRGGGM